MNSILNVIATLHLALSDDEGATSGESVALLAAVIILIVVVAQTISGGGLLELRDQIIQNQINLWRWRN